MEAKSTELILIRHGETSWNREQRIQGQLDGELSPAGVEQARAVADRMASQEFTALISSDLNRARQMAEAIAERTGHKVILEPGLRERHFGIFQGLTWREIEEKHPDLYRAYWAGPDFAPPGGGEAARQRHARAVECVSRLAAVYAGQRIVLVTHGGVLSSVFKHAAGLDAQAPRRFSLYNAAINVLRVTDGQWEIKTWGDIGHLCHMEVSDDY